MSCPGTIGGAVPISTSGSIATGWPLYVTSNNNLRRHSRKMFSVDSCQWTDRCPAYGNNPFLLHVAFQPGLQRVKAKVIFPQFLLHPGWDTPTTSLYLSWKYQGVWEPNAVFKIHNIREYPRQFGRAEWMNKDRKHVGRKKLLYWQMCPKLLLYNLTDDQRLGENVILIQPWVK